MPSSIVWIVGAFAVLGFVASISHAGAVLGAKALEGRFCWFDSAPISEQPWRSFLIRGCSVFGAAAVAIALLFAGHLTRGNVVLTTKVIVLPGAAATAGLEDGDRITRVDSSLISDFDDIRAEIQRGVGARRIEVERNGELLVFNVTPVEGRIGVNSMTDNRPLGVSSAFFRAVAAPALLVNTLLDGLTQARRVDVAGPIGVVQATTSRDVGSYLLYLGHLANTAALLVLGVHAFDALTFAVFRATHKSRPTVATSRIGRSDHARPLRAARLTRRYQALLIALTVSLVYFIVHFGHDASLGTRALSGIEFLFPGVASALLLVCLVSAERWGRKAAWASAVFSIALPPLPLILAPWFLYWLRAELKCLRASP